MKKQERRETLDQHILSTYFELRAGLAALAFAFPLLLLVVGYLQSTAIPLLGSMSDYYWAGSNDNARWLRDIFVGFLMAIGMALYVYKGFSDKEDRALNIAAVCAFLVAFFPMNHLNKPLSFDVPLRNVFFIEPVRGYIHGATAILLFLCIGYVAIWRSRDTFKYLPPHANKKLFDKAYTVIGHAMWVLPLLITAANFATRFLTAKNQAHTIYALEFFGIYVFGAFWAVKTHEIRMSCAEAEVIHTKPPKTPQ